jgi:hypothetical protein
MAKPGRRMDISARVYGWTKLHHCSIHYCTFGTDSWGCSVRVWWVTRTTFVFFSRIRTVLQELRLWSILFASVFYLKSYVWRGVLHFCCVAELLWRWRVLREWMSCSGDEIMRMWMIGRSDLPWLPKCAISLLTSYSRSPSWIAGSSEGMV